MPLEEPYRRLVLDYMNKIFSGSPESRTYWTVALKKMILKKFGPEALTPEEAAPEFCLRDLLLLTPEEPSSSRTPKPSPSPSPTTPHSSAPPTSRKWLGWPSKKSDTKSQQPQQQPHPPPPPPQQSQQPQQPQQPQQQPGYNQNGLLLLLHQLKKMIGISFSQHFNEELKVNRTLWHKKAIFSPLDIKAINERVKHLGLMHHALGYIYRVCITTLHNTTLHNTTQHSTTQHNTTQHNTHTYTIYSSSLRPKVCDT